MTSKTKHWYIAAFYGTYCRWGIYQDTDSCCAIYASVFIHDDGGAFVRI